MSNAEIDKVVSKQAQLACLEVAKDVVAKAKQTNTPIIIFADDRILHLTPDEYERQIGKKRNAPTKVEDPYD
jgi:hypothetical protein